MTDRLKANAPHHFIKEWRKHRRLTQVQLAERMEMARSYLSLIESGRRRYDQPFLERAAEELNCSPADLIMRNPADPDGLWSIYDGLTAPQRKQAVQLLRVLIGGKAAGE
jgi:transcriptional regulator with XRE-family HTH domain